MSETIEQEQQAIAKDLRLRGPARSVTQVSRKALVVTGAVLAAGVAGALAWSLRDHQPVPASRVVSQAATPPEQVRGLPKDYLRRADTPVLGPPLPGDLGRPIVSAQRARNQRQALEPQTASAQPVYDPRPTAQPDPAIAARQSARQVTREAARASDLFATAASHPGEPSGAASSAPAGAETLAEDTRTTSPERLRGPASPYLLQAGSIIPAALVTGLRSDANGLAIAQVSQDVYDSLGGHHRLIPAGARLIGEYETTTRAGQSRLSVAWTRLILPSGRSIVLDKLPAADAQGMAGLQDGVDRHGRAVLAAAALSTVLAIGGQAGQSSGGSDLERAIRRGASESVSDFGQQAVGRSLNLAPTLTIRPGAPLRVLLSRDLVLEPYSEETRP
jgi:type IV secretory pathway VirB10-like protein